MSLLLSVKVQCFLRSLVFEPWGRALETMLKGAALWTWMVRKLLKVLPSCCPQQGPFAPGPWASPALFSGFWLLRRDQLRISNHNRGSHEVKGKNEVLAHQSSKRLREWAAKGRKWEKAGSTQVPTPVTSLPKGTYQRSVVSYLQIEDRMFLVLHQTCQEER